MNKKISKAFLAIVLCLVTILAVPNVEVEAAKPKIKGGNKIIITQGSEHDLYIKLPKGLKRKQVKMSKIKYSNKGVVSIGSGGSYYPQTGLYNIGCDVYKTGKTKVSFTLKVKNKRYNYSITVISGKKYTNPVKSFKIGNREVASRFKKMMYGPSCNLNGKIIKVVPKRHWKLVAIVGYGYDGHDTIHTTFKNNTRIQTPGVEYYAVLCVTLKNTKTGVTQKLRVVGKDSPGG